MTLITLYSVFTVDLEQDAQDMVKDLDMFAEDQVDPRVVTAEAQERKRRIEKIELAEAR